MWLLNLIILYLIISGALLFLIKNRYLNFDKNTYYFFMIFLISFSILGYIEGYKIIGDTININHFTYSILLIGLVHSLIIHFIYSLFTIINKDTTNLKSVIKIIMGCFEEKYTTLWCSLTGFSVLGIIGFFAKIESLFN